MAVAAPVHYQTVNMQRNTSIDKYHKIQTRNEGALYRDIEHSNTLVLTCTDENTIKPNKMKLGFCFTG